MKAFWDDHKASLPHESTQWAASDRGWLFIHGADSSIGNYLDYGPDHWRSPESRAEQPGNVHAVRYIPTSFARATAQYFETVEAAKAWIEAGFPGLQVQPDLFPCAPTE